MFTSNDQTWAEGGISATYTWKWGMGSMTAYTNDVPSVAASLRRWGDASTRKSLSSTITLLHHHHRPPSPPSPSSSSTIALLLHHRPSPSSISLLPHQFVLHPTLIPCSILHATGQYIAVFIMTLPVTNRTHVDQTFGPMTAETVKAGTQSAGRDQTTYENNLAGGTNNGGSDVYNQYNQCITINYNSYGPSSSRDTTTPTPSNTERGSERQVILCALGLCAGFALCACALCACALGACDWGACDWGACDRAAFALCELARGGQNKRDFFSRLFCLLRDWVCGSGFWVWVLLLFVNWVCGSGIWVWAALCHIQCQIEQSPKREPRELKPTAPDKIRA
ncbi:hypothetical protein HYFRA_00006303 [Hymenoscyphus fraxineus]|uniref:Uncharacterized protein n=1 Tax=Hymenoscyphus fraxineus TaxID=746836 RepID=A0A9N9PZT1_9HELO|nr:hypothetical protein HYFRA_00006303 [Hymenoscyphus fraxineus]